MSKNTPYEKCILRTPLYSWDRLGYDTIESIISLPDFKEAILIASPSLYSEIYIKHNLSQKIINSLMKFFSRICTRCTPYGIFAGCSVVPLSKLEKSDIILSSIDKFKTYTRVDMNFLGDMIRTLEKSPEIRSRLLYHINSSLYRLWKKYRYIEYHVTENKREYSFSEINGSSYLNRIILSLNGTERTILDLAMEIKNKVSVELEEAVNYLNILIDNQIIVSNLEPSVCGKDLIYQMEYELSRVGLNDNLISTLINKLRECDAQVIGEHIEYYDNIYEILNVHDFTSYSDNPIHVDCLTAVQKGGISDNIVTSVRKGIEVIKKISRKSSLPDLETFKTKFYDLYEEEEVPLTVALDTQIGVGYASWTNTNGDVNPILDGVPFPSFKFKDESINMDVLTHFLFDKYQKAIKNGSTTITITAEDLKIFPEYKGPISLQEYTIFSVINNSDKPEIIITGIGCTTSAKLLSRFEYLDEEIKHMVDEITSDEQNDYKDSIVAEILHLPEDRIGNVQMHPSNRKYGVCYFSNPCSCNVKKVIPISDIMISVPRGNHIVLRSKKYNKQIIPKLSTAHNYIYGLPIYRFLCDLQLQDYMDYEFNWGALFMNEAYLPRIQYENIILCPARFLITSNDYPQYKGFRGDELQKQIIKWMNTYKLPRKFLLVEGDNKLFIDLENKYLVDILLDEFKKKKTLHIEEFCYTNDKANLVSHDGQPFTNEIIMCFHNK